MVLLSEGIYGSQVVIIEEGTNVVGWKQVQETRKITDGWLEEFSELWSEVRPCQSQGSKEIIFLRCIPRCNC